MNEQRTIRKYPNRRLYDPTESRYLCLGEIQKLVRDGVDFGVIEKLTGKDITQSVLLQVIAAEERGEVSLLTREFLLEMIRCQQRGPRSLAASYLEQSLNLLERQGQRPAKRKTAAEHPAGMALRLAQKHYQRWCAVQEDICRKLEN